MNRITAVFIAVLALLVGGYLAWDGSGRPWIGDGAASEGGAAAGTGAPQQATEGEATAEPRSE